MDSKLLGKNVERRLVEMYAEKASSEQSALLQLREMKSAWRDTYTIVLQHLTRAERDCEERVALLRRQKREAAPAEENQ